jgi:hypothetical protein
MDSEIMEGQMKLFILSMTTLIAIGLSPAYAEKPKPAAPPAKEPAAKVVAPVAPKPAAPVAAAPKTQATVSRDKLINYILNNNDIPNQQTLLRKLLENEKATDEVFTKLPVKDQNKLKAGA